MVMCRSNSECGQIQPVWGFTAFTLSRVFDHNSILCSVSSCFCSEEADTILVYRWPMITVRQVLDTFQRSVANNAEDAVVCVNCHVLGIIVKSRHNPPTTLFSELGLAEG